MSGRSQLIDASFRAAIVPVGVAAAVYAVVIVGSAASSRDTGMLMQLASLPMLAAIALVVALMHVLVLGLPAFAMLHRSNRATASSMAVTGFILGASPAALFMAFRLGHATRGPLLTPDNHLTGDGWSALCTIVFMGAMGIIGAHAFLAALRRHASTEAPPD